MKYASEYRCPNCSSVRISKRLFAKKGCDYYRCDSCDLVMRLPIPSPESLKGIYTADYYSAWGLEQNEGEVERAKRITFANWWKSLRPFLSAGDASSGPRRILDIGCANGVLLQVAQELGFEPWGVELSEHAAQISRRKFGNERIFCGTPENAGHPSGFFDVVSMCDLIEHVPEPAAALASARRALKDGGLLLLTTPDARSFSARLLRSYWPNFLPEHIFYFNRRNAARLLRENGFQALTVKIAWKCLTPHYIASWFARNRIPFFSSLLQALAAAMPRALLHCPMFFALGDILLVARKVEKAEKPPVEKVSVIVPAYNEEATIKPCLEAILKSSPLGLPLEIVVVESNSRDRTRSIAQDLAKSLPIRLILEDRPRGKGHAVRAGIAASTGQVLIIQDADLEYSPSDYENLVMPIARGHADFVMGSRVLGARSWAIRRFNDELFESFVFNFGGLAVNAFFNILYGTRLTDQATMFKVFRRDALEGLELASNSWDLDVEIVAKLVRSGHVPQEVPVHYRSRSSLEGKKMRFADVFLVLGAMIRFRRGPAPMNAALLARALSAGKGGCNNNGQPQPEDPKSSSKSAA